MKKFSFYVFTLLILFSCSKTNFKINGISQLSDFQEGKIYLSNMQDSILDSAYVKKGKFSLSQICDTVQLVQLSSNNSNLSRQIRRIMLMEKGVFTATIDSTGFVSITGSPSNDALTDYLQKSREYDAKYERALNVSKESADAVDRESTELAYGFCKDNAQSPVGAMIFERSYYTMSIEQRENIISLLPENLKTGDKITKIISSTNQEKLVSVGKQYIDYKSFTPKGDTLAISQLVGKTDYLLLDFWASWCRYCIKDLPSLRAFYDKYHGTKFDILGISLDNNKDNWTAAIQKYGLQWQQISDLKKWDSDLPKIYAVNYIPYTILIDKTGKIIGRNLNINQIEDIITDKSVQRR